MARATIEGPLTSLLRGWCAAIECPTPRATFLRRVVQKYEPVRSATSVKAMATAAENFGRWTDRNLSDLRTHMPENRWSLFRGGFLEETALKVSKLVAARLGVASKLHIGKFGTGQGIVTGIGLAYSRRAIGDVVTLQLTRDREDVIIGVPRTFTLDVEPVNPGPEGSLDLANEQIPLCVIACKVYVDATRLENVIAKARSIKAMYSSCTFLVCSEWDALGGKDWHDDDGHLLDSRIVPVDEIVFLRGYSVRRPPNDQLGARSLEYPVLRGHWKSLALLIQGALEPWIQALKNPRG